MGWPATVIAGVGVAVYLAWQVFGWGGAGHKDQVGDLAFLPFNGGAAVAAGFAAHANRRVRTTCRGWWLLAVGLTSYLAGDVIQMYYELGPHQDLPFPSWADAGYLAFYPLTLVALLTFLPAPRSRDQRVALVLDVATVAVGGWAVIWTVDLGPTVAVGADTPFALVTSLAYPIGDLILLFGTLVLLWRARYTHAALPAPLLLTGFALYLITDMVYSHAQLSGSYQGGDPVDAGWIIAQTMLGLAAVAHVRQPAAPAAVRPDPNPWRRRRLDVTALPYLAVGVGFALLVLDVRHLPWNPLGGLVAAAVILTGLVNGRQWTTLRENARLLAEYHTLAATDPLTGLNNRRRLLELGEAAYDQAHRRDRPLSLLVIDIDHFKHINDQYGHQAGDQVLCAVADACRRQLRTYDLLGRYGGDEFVAILPETSLPDALAIADRLRQGVADTPTMIPSRPTLSIGVAEITDTRNLDALVARADIALYTAKNHGRDQAQPYTMA